MAFVRIAVTILIGLLAMAAVLAQGGRAGSALDVLANFAVIYLAGGALVLVLTVANPHWRGRGPMVFLAALASMGALALIMPELRAVKAPVAAAPVEDRLKIIQFNLKGDDEWNGRTVDWLISQNPDVVVLQDLGPNMRAALVRRRVGWRLNCAKNCEVALLSRIEPERFWAYQGGAYGLTPRTVLASFELDHRQFTVVGVHLARPHVWAASSPQSVVHVQTEHSRQLREILRSVEQNTAILVGDFNSTPWSFDRQREDAMLGLERRTRFLFSWPANPTGLALLPIDHIYAGSAWRTASVSRGPYLGSDHYPIVAVLARSGSE